MLFFGEGFEVVKLNDRFVVAGGAQFFHQGFDRLDGGSHFAGNAEFGVGVVAQQVGHFVAQFEDALDIGGIVQISFRSSGDEGAIDFFPQVATAAVLQKGNIAGVVEGNAPGTGFGSSIFSAIFPSCLSRQGQQAGGATLLLPEGQLASG